MMRRQKFRIFLLCFFFIFLSAFLLLITVGSSTDFDKRGGTEEEEIIEWKDQHGSDEQAAINEDITQPIILWWTPFTGEKGRYKTCGDVKCFFTVDRHYQHHQQTKVFLFYGTDFKEDDLPLPRLTKHEWGLMHEESPKNNYMFSHEEVMTLFNHTCTFKRESDYPITTQYLQSLKWLESAQYMISVKEKNKMLSELSPIIYTQSDCHTPSDRDTYVKLLMKYIPIDSYGTCLHNKNLPKHLSDPLKGMDHEDFYRLNAQYKFSIAMENGICKDYITEKLWRPLVSGSVPIVFGSPEIQELLPSNHSAIIIDKFDDVESLADYIKYINENDKEYEKYLQWKKTGISNKVLKDIIQNRGWSVNNDWRENEYNFIDGFECFVCKRIHENNKRLKTGQELLKYQATVDHYGCPAPLKFDNIGKRVNSTSWASEWLHTKFLSKALRYFIDKNISYKKKDLQALANKLLNENVDKLDNLILYFYNKNL